MTKCATESEQSMVFDVHLSEAFQADLEEALDYICEDLASPIAGASLMAEVDKAKELLALQPFMHAAVRKPEQTGREYRGHHVKSYVIVYKVAAEAVVFLRLFHQSQLYERHVLDW